MFYIDLCRKNREKNYSETTKPKALIFGVYMYLYTNVYNMYLLYYEK